MIGILRGRNERHFKIVQSAKLHDTCSSSMSTKHLPLYLTLGQMLAGKRAFIAGVSDDNGYGWAIAKSLAAAGAEILVGTWVPVCKLI
jgi:hypothetical protein